MRRFYITSYRNYLIENQYELSTINKKVNSIRSFNRYLVYSGYTKDVVVDIAKDRVKLAYGSERQVEALEEKQVERILFYIQNNEKVNKRDKMIILLLLYTGLRVNKLCDIITFVYDEAGRLIEKVDPYGMGIQRLEYNKNRIPQSIPMTSMDELKQISRPKIVKLWL